MLSKPGTGSLERETLEKLAIKTLDAYFPDLMSKILNHKINHAPRPRTNLLAHRRRLESRPAHARSIPLHAADSRLVQSQNAHRWALSMRKRRARRRRSQRRKRQKCNEGNNLTGPKNYELGKFMTTCSFVPRFQPGTKIQKRMYAGRMPAYIPFWYFRQRQQVFTKILLSVDFRHKGLVGNGRADIASINLPGREFHRLRGQIFIRDQAQ